MSALNQFFKFPSRPKPRPDVVTIPTDDGVTTAYGPFSVPAEIAEDCNPIGMSYWRNINNHKNSAILRVFLSIHDQINILTIDKRTFNVIERRDIGIHHTGEGCYFSALDPEILFVPMSGQLYRVDIFTGQSEIVWSPDSSKRLWQCHSSYSEKVHSATIQDSNYEPVFWAVYNEDTKQEYFFTFKGDKQDECQIDKSGQYLLIKEANKINEDQWDEYNRIIDLSDLNENVIFDEHGAVGHSDNGFGCAIGENDKSSMGGALDHINFESLMRKNLFTTGIWNMGYFSFTNAVPGPLETQKGLVTTPTELISVKLDGSGIGKTICSNLTESQDYKHRPKANLCPLGEFAVWTAFVDGKVKAFIVPVPNW